MLFHEPNASEVERLYRAIADGEPRLELLQRFYDVFGDQHGLRPPASEARLADNCKPKAVTNG